MGTVFARKFNRAKWEPVAGLAAEEIGADAVTVDLRTTSNELSFWDCTSNDDAELNEAVLALATGQNRLDKMDVAWIEKEAIHVEQLTVQPSPGNAATPVESLKERHVDVSQLDLVRLGKVAGLMQKALSAEQWKRFARKEVLALVVAAVNAGRLKVEALKDEMRSAVEDEVRKAQQG